MGYKIYSGNTILTLNESDFIAFKASYTLIQAAGGLVRDELDRLLFIFRREKWDLPKGKLDDGETIEACAQREVEEECGIKVLTVNELAYITYHTYEEKGNQILKETFWFNMRSSNQQPLIPQIEEQIIALEWADQVRQQALLENTYPMIRDMVISVNQKPL